jgi:hypothetical protein
VNDPRTYKPPPLPSDALGGFVGSAEHNTLATAANLPQQWARLSAIDSLFQSAGENLNESPSWFAGVFLIRAHSAYRAAVRLSTSGQLPEAYAVMRLSLECALYARFLEDDLERQQRWLQRSDTAENRKVFRNEFTTRALFDALKFHDSWLGGYAGRLYQFLIDYGAHPNDLGLASVSSLQADADRIRVETSQLQASGEVFDGCLLTNARVGVTVLSTFETIFRHRFALLGITQALQRERSGL